MSFQSIPTTIDLQRFCQLVYRHAAHRHTKGVGEVLKNFRHSHVQTEAYDYLCRLYYEETIVSA